MLLLLLVITELAIIKLSLQAKSAYIKATMGSEVDVYVTDQLEASAGWGAMIDYTGGPNVRHSNTSMGGEIYHKRRH